MRPQSWHDRIWGRLAEPAWITGFQIGSFLSTAAIGFVVVLGSPELLAGEIGMLMTFVVGLVLMFGGIIGALSCRKGVWWVERIALMLCGLGWILLVPSIAFGDLHDLVRAFILAMLVLAVFDVAKRYRRIDWAYLDPSK